VSRVFLEIPYHRSAGRTVRDSALSAVGPESLALRLCQGGVGIRVTALQKMKLDPPGGESQSFR